MTADAACSEKRMGEAAIRQQTRCAVDEKNAPKNCSDYLNSPFEISEMPKTLVPHYIGNWSRGKRSGLSDCLNRVDDFQE